MPTTLRRLAALAAALFVAACSDTAVDPTAAPDAVTADGGLDAAAPKFWEVNAAADWNVYATELAAATAIDAARLYAYLSLAQLRAAEAAEAIRPHPPTFSAISAASASVLASFFPASASAIEARLASRIAAEPWPGAKHEDAGRGTAIGRQVASAVLAFAATDGTGLTSPGTPPTTPGSWVWNGGPIVRGLYRARPFYLASGADVLPPPPPVYGSPEFVAALDEVRSISLTRTPEQVAIAQYWHVNQSGRSGAAMNNLAVELIRSHRLSDARAALVLWRMNSATFDALVGCFEAKYHYWYIRPQQADPVITLATPMPAHPSYPSAHSCISGASTGVLAAEFPDEASRVQAIAEEAGYSRVLGGLHYRFDARAGIDLGRAVAARVMAADQRQVATLP